VPARLNLWHSRIARIDRRLVAHVSRTSPAIWILSVTTSRTGAQRLLTCRPRSCRPSRSPGDLEARGAPMTRAFFIGGGRLELETIVDDYLSNQSTTSR